MTTNKKYSMDARWNLSPEIYERIKNKFQENKTRFSRIDFIDLAKKYNKKISSVSRILAHLEEKNKIVKVGEMATSRGGWSVNLYQALSGVNFIDKYQPDYRETMENIERYNAECALRLHKALDMVVRMNIRTKNIHERKQ